MTRTCSRFRSILILVLHTALVLVARPIHAEELASWRIQWANDVVLTSDNQFTNGFTIEKHSPVAPSLTGTNGTPAVGKRMAQAFLPLGAGLSYRETWAFGENMQTPADLARTDLIVDDIPYASMLAVANTFVAFDDRRFAGFEWLVGFVGPSVGGERAQRYVHKTLGADEPRGWANQLSDEPLLNFYYMRKRKLVDLERFDLAVNFDAALGNFFTFGEGSVEFRFGRRPAGFAAAPSPIGRGMTYDARLPFSQRNTVYTSLVLRGTQFLRALPREGNTFARSNAWTRLHTVEMERSVGQAILGLHVVHSHWMASLSAWVSTDTLKRGGLAHAEQPDNSFAVVAVEWRPVDRR